MSALRLSVDFHLGEAYNLVAFTGFHEGNPLGTPALGSDTLYRRSRDNPVGGNEHDLLRRRHNPGVGQLPCLLGYLEGPDAAAGPVLFGVVGNRRQFTESTGGNHQQERLAMGDAGADDAISLIKADTPYSATHS